MLYRAEPRLAGAGLRRRGCPLPSFCPVVVLLGRGPPHALLGGVYFGGPARPAALSLNPGSPLGFGARASGPLCLSADLLLASQIKVETIWGCGARR